MVRTMPEDTPKLFRAVVTVTVNGHPRETAYGPYSTIGAARNVGNREVNLCCRYGRGDEISVRIESTSLNWVPVN